MTHVRAYTAQKASFQASVEQLRNQMVEFMRMDEHVRGLQRDIRSLRAELECSRSEVYSLLEDLNRFAIKLELDPIPVKHETPEENNPGRSTLPV